MSLERVCVCVFLGEAAEALPQPEHHNLATGTKPHCLETLLLFQTHTHTNEGMLTNAHTHTHTLSGPSLSFSSAHFPKQGCLMRGLSKLSDSQSRINRKHSSGSVLFCQSINTGMLQKRNNVKKTKYDFRTLCGHNVPTTKTH